MPLVEIDGRRVLGLGACEVARDGTVYLCGAVDEPDESKVAGRAAGRDDAVPGEIVTCKVDLALLLDSGGPRRIWPRLKELGVGVWAMLIPFMVSPEGWLADVLECMVTDRIRAQRIREFVSELEDRLPIDERDEAILLLAILLGVRRRIRAAGEEERAADEC